MAVRELARTYGKERYRKWIILYYILPGAAALLARWDVSRIILSGMAMVTAQQAAAFFSQVNINCINYGFGGFQKNRAKYILGVSLLLAVPWFMAEIVKIMISGMPWHTVLYAALGCLFFTVLGDVIGVAAKDGLAAYTAIVAVAFWLLQKPLVHELYFRYASPLLLFEKKENVFCILGIVLASAVGILFVSARSAKGQAKAVLLYLAGIAAVTTGESFAEQQLASGRWAAEEAGGYVLEYKESLGEAYAGHLARLLHGADGVLQAYGFDIKTERYEVGRSIYFPWDGPSAKVFMRRQGSKVSVDCYAETLRNLSDEEIIVRYLYAVIKPSTSFQEVVLDLLAQDVPSQVLKKEKPEELQKYSYDSLVNDYGSCVSPKQCVVEECMLKAEGELFRLYQELGKISGLPELDVEAFSDGAYKEVLRRIQKDG